MAIECAYSFSDLFEAVYLRKPTIKETANFGNMNQEDKNNIVKKWAQKAGWETKERIGTDGLLYIAFAPTFTKNKERNDFSKYGTANC
jgi:hypothetical protein